MKGWNIIDKILALLMMYYSWVRKCTKNIVISIFVFLAVLTVIIVVAKIMLPILLVSSAVIYVFFGEMINKRAPPPQTLWDDVVCHEIIKFMFIAISNANDVLSTFVHMPRTESDICTLLDCRGVYHNAPILKARMIRKRNSDLTQDDCDYIKSVLQSMVNARVHDGYLSGYPWNIQAAITIPIIKVATVENSEMFIHIGILLTNTDVSAQAARLSDEKPPPPTGGGEDPFFK